METRTVINGRSKTLDVQPGERLSDLIRREGYRGVKIGCESGDCGSCVVLVDDRPVNSCLFPAPRIEGKRITTIEGLGTPDEPHILQKAFVEVGAVQCGYCIPGSILSSSALLRSNPDPTEGDIRRALDGNLCRCTGYVKKLDAVKKAVERMKGGGNE